MTALQLELNLWQRLAEAQQSPQAVDWQQLCLAFDEAIDRTPVGLRLATAADAIAEMADVFAARADEFFSTWHRQRVAHEGPILDDDLFDEFVRQSFHLDLDDLVGVPELYVRSASEKSHEEIESVVGEVTKETALLLAGTELEPEPMIVVQPYDENVGEWAKAIALWMQQQKLDRVEFAELLDGVGYPVVKGWLAVLLDEGFAMDRLEGSDFYRSTGILVALKQEEIAESLCGAIAC
jgi:uncharacterized protein YggL (DUF469 family)